jgi:outer membrane protein TolC
MTNKNILLPLFILISTGLSAQRIINIEEAIATALQNNYDIQLSKNDSLVAALDYSFRNAAFQPRLNATTGLVLNNNDQKQKFADGTVRQRKGIRSDNLTGSVQLNWVVFDGMKMFITRDKMAQLIQQGSLGIRNQAVQTTAAIINTYYQAVRQKQQLKAIATQLQVSDERLKLAQFRLQNGSGNKPDVLQSQVDKNAQRSAQLTWQLQLEQQKEQLLRLMNIAAGQEFDVTDSIPINTQLGYTEINAVAEKENPGLRSLQKEIDIARFTLKERKAERLPVVSFNSAYNYGKLNNKAVVNPFSPLFSRNNGFNFGLTATVPILDNQQNKRLTKQVALDIQLRQLNYEREKANISLAVLQAYKNYRAQIALLKLEEENIAIAQENLQIVQQTYKLGAGTFIQYREAQKSLEEAQNRLIGVRYAAKLAETELMRLKGGW